MTVTTMCAALNFENIYNISRIKTLLNVTSWAERHADSLGDMSHMTSLAH